MGSLICRVKFREEKFKEKVDEKRKREANKETEKEEQEKRLEALRETVRPQVNVDSFCVKTPFLFLPVGFSSF